MKKSLCLFLACAVSVWSQSWTDISTTKVNALISQYGAQAYPGGCSGVVVNRLNGDVVIKIIGWGLWRSSDQGATWTQIDQNTVSGRCETGVALNADQDNPVRIASFSLDGDCGYTPDGTTWHKWTGMGRNWDFGSVDWGAANPLVLLAAKHEDGGKVFKSTDGGQTWIQLSITVNAQSNNTSSMIGVMDANTFIYCANGGIQRSTNQGSSWTQVYASAARTKFPVLFNGKHYLGTASGLIVSTDKGATWTRQGAAVEICQGPFFGADENTMVMVNTQGVYKSTNAGTAWTKVANLPTNCSGNTFDVAWFGGFSWDPVHNTIYATRMVCPAYKYSIPGTGTISSYKSGSVAQKGMVRNSRIILANNRILVDAGVKKVYNIKGIKFHRP